MRVNSEPSLLVLHAVRLLGFAPAEDIARRSGLQISDTSKILEEAQRAGWVQMSGFADLRGWALTENGKSANERQLKDERVKADPDGVVSQVYREFLPRNERMLRAVTDWQMRPTESDRFAVNDHTDAEWDERILKELDALGVELLSMCGKLTAVIQRFAGYSEWFDAALTLAEEGRHDWVDATTVDSCHKVWFQLHEDLIATLGIDRGTEEAADTSANG